MARQGNWPREANPQVSREPVRVELIHWGFPGRAGVGQRQELGQGMLKAEEDRVSEAYINNKCSERAGRRLTDRVAESTIWRRGGAEVRYMKQREDSR